jgi:hypothetical protein
MVTRSGTKSFHGVGYDFERNSKLDARPCFSVPTTTLAPFSRRQFGGDLSGPIWRDKVLFFVDYEGLRQAYPHRANSIAPTALQRAGDFSQTFTAAGAPTTIYDPDTVVGNTRQAFSGNKIPQLRIDPAAAAVMALYPLPNVTGASYNYTFSDNTQYNSDKYDIRVDTNLDEKTRPFVIAASRIRALV